MNGDWERCRFQRHGNLGTIGICLSAMMRIASIVYLQIALLIGISAFWHVEQGSLVTKAWCLAIYGE